MSKKKKILIIGGLILVVQLLYFADYISPFYWGQLKVRGLACTCPDEKVVNGHSYLKSITPDSLKKYALDYSEIYVSERPSTDIDPMGVDLYIIEGQVIGKDRVSIEDPWNPILKIDKWREIEFLKDWGIKGFFFAQLFIWLILIRQARNKNGAQ